MTANTNFNVTTISRALKELQNDSHYVRLCLMLLQKQIQIENEKRSYNCRMFPYIFFFRQTWNCILAAEHPVYKVTNKHDVNTQKGIAILNLYPPLHSKHK